MLGNPRFKEDDLVSFVFDNQVYTGSIAIIDRWGTCEQNEEVSYDVLVENYKGGKCLIKHLRESCLQTTTPFDEIKTALKEAITLTSMNHCAGCEWEFDGNSIECLECHKKILGEKESEDEEK